MTGPQSKSWEGPEWSHSEHLSSAANAGTPKKWDTTYEWQTVLLLTLGFGLVGLDRWIIAPLAPAMIGDLQLTPSDINNLVAVLGIAWGVAAIFLGGLSDRVAGAGRS